MGAAAGIGADEHPAAQLPGQLGQRDPGRLNVLGRGVGPALTRCALANLMEPPS